MLIQNPLRRASLWKSVRGKFKFIKAIKIISSSRASWIQDLVNLRYLWFKSQVLMLGPVKNCMQLSVVLCREWTKGCLTVPSLPLFLIRSGPSFETTRNLWPSVHPSIRPLIQSNDCSRDLSKCHYRLLQIFSSKAEIRPWTGENIG